MAKQLDFDAYEELELKVGCTSDEIKRAYKRLALQWHPDKCKKKEAQQKFVRIRAAYECLSDAKSRAVHDSYLRAKAGMQRSAKEMRHQQEQSMADAMRRQQEQRKADEMRRQQEQPRTEEMRRQWKQRMTDEVRSPEYQRRAEELRRQAVQRYAEEIQPKSAYIRPITGYMLWQRENREDIMKKIGSKQVTDVSKEAGKQWNALSEAEKQWWKKLASGKNVTIPANGSKGAKRAAGQEDTANTSSKRAKGADS